MIVKEPLIGKTYDEDRLKEVNLMLCYLAGLGWNMSLSDRGDGPKGDGWGTLLLMMLLLYRLSGVFGLTVT